VGLERPSAQVTPVTRGLILGGSGFVGRELMSSLGWPGTSSTPRDGFLAVDATRPAELVRTVRDTTPEVIINCIGLADVDRAERDPPLADRLNRLVVANLRAVQRDQPFRLVQVSTDYVFDGLRGGYRETDPPHPINEYGRSKLEGERCLSDSPTSLILRLSSPFGRGFGARKPQFFRYLADALRVGKPVTALTDQRVTATYLPDLAEAIRTLLARGACGVFHLTSEEALTRFEFALRVADAVGADPNLVRPGLRADMTQWAAPRPADTSLDVGRSRASGVVYTPVSVALRTVLSDPTPTVRN